MNCEIFHQYPWYTRPHLGLSHHASAKAGTQTLLKSIIREWGYTDPGYGRRRALIHRDLVPDGYVLAETVPTGDVCVQILRHPIYRFLSLYKEKVLQAGDGVPADMYNIRSPEELFDYISADPYGNVHWTPQSTVVGATNYVRLEDFGKFHGLHENKADEPDPLLSPDMTRKIRNLYSTDVLLYASAHTKKPPLM